MGSAIPPRRFIRLTHRVHILEAKSRRRKSAKPKRRGS